MADSTDEISPHVRIRIEPEKKKEWLEYAEEHHHGNLTSLIKDAVDNTISDEWILADEAADPIDDIEFDPDLGEITDRLAVIENQLNEIVLQDVEAEDDLDRDELIKLAKRCHDNLPVARDGRALKDMTIDAVTYEPRFRVKITGTVQDIATFLDEPNHQVRRALIFLENQETNNVESIVEDGVRRWFERDSSAGTEEIPLELEEGMEVDWKPGTAFEDQDADRPPSGRRFDNE